MAAAEHYSVQLDFLFGYRGTLRENEILEFD